MSTVPSNLVPTRISSLPEYQGGSLLGYVPYVLSGVTYKVQMAQLDIGTVTSVDGSGGTTGLTLTGGPITASGTLTLGGTLAVANGGTGSATAALARAALLPAYAGNALKRLTVNAGATDVEWVADGGGTVTSVAQSFTGGLISVSGSPVTGAGTLALTVAGTSGGIPYFSSASTWATSAALAANALVIGGGAGAAPATTTTGAGVITLLAGASSGTGGPAGTASPTLTGTPTLNDATLPYWILSRASTAKAYLGISDGSSILSGPAAGDTFFRNEGTLWIGAGGNTTAAKFASTLVTFPVAINYGGVTLSNSVTGTGSMVLSASPTLTGGVTIDGGGTAQPLALNSTAANGVYTRYTNSGTAIGYIGTPKQVISGGLSAADFAIAAAGGDLYLNGNSAIYAYIAGGAVGRFTSTGMNSTAIGASTPSTGAFTTGNFSGVVTLSSTNGENLRITGATTGPNILSLTNTGGQAIFGQENSAGGNIIIGSTAYDTVIRGPSGISFSANAGGSRSARITSTGINSTAIGATTPSTGAFTTITASGASVSCGTASTTQGSLVLHNTSANSVTLKSSNSTSAAYTLTLPVDDGTSGQVLSTDGSGVTSWITASGAEYGTWTPGISFGGGTTGITYGTQTGTYVKSGRSVLYGIYVTLTSKGSSAGGAKVTGCPYTSDTTAPYSFVNVITGTNITCSAANTPVLTTYWTGSTTGIDVGQISLGTPQQLSDTAFTNTSYIYGSINLTTTA